MFDLTVDSDINFILFYFDIPMDGFPCIFSFLYGYIESFFYVCQIFILS